MSCGDNDFIMCDIPQHHIEQAFSAWFDFKANPGSHSAFDDFDWVFRVAAVKWATYALNRRIEASSDKPLP